MPRKGWKSITIRESLYNLLKELAEKNDFSISEQADIILKEHMELQ